MIAVSVAHDHGGGASRAPASPHAVALLTGQQRLILRELSRGHLMTIDQLVATLYGLRHDGGPDAAQRVVHTQLGRLRAVLGSVGIAVLTIGRTKGARGYRIDPDHLAHATRLLGEMAAMDLDLARSRSHLTRANLVG